MKDRIVATNETIKDIVEQEIRKLGPNADLNKRFLKKQRPPLGERLKQQAIEIGMCIVVMIVFLMGALLVMTSNPLSILLIVIALNLISLNSKE